MESYGFSIADLVAGCWFLLAWIGYGVAVEHPSLAHRSLNARMDRYRTIWMHRMLDRDLRIVDTTIMASLQNGTAFFASTSLIALGGALSFLRAPADSLQIFSALPFATHTTQTEWEVKVVGVSMIFAYAFFKFAWSYRLMNYAAILIGAAPHTGTEDPAAVAMADRAAAMNTVAGGHFNRGQRAFFFAVGYLGWFVGAAFFMMSTAAVLIVMARRQFGPNAQRALPFID